MKFFTVFAVTAVVVTAGCATGGKGASEKEIAAYLADKPEDVSHLYRPVAAQPENDRVKYQLQAALGAMSLGHFDLAAATFDDALLTIEAIYADNAEAEAARGKFQAEKSKVFRGESYERAMAYYHRGILFLMEGDYENARASFKTGFLQDTVSDREEYRGDFALLEFLEGWASQCNGNHSLASEAYSRAKASQSELVIPGRRDNTLVLADLGYAPEKFAEGEYNHVLKLKAQDSISTPEVNGGITWVNAGARAQLANSEDIAWQATTRGGREFDAILAGQAQYKEEKKESAEKLAAASGVFADVATQIAANSTPGEMTEAELITGTVSYGLAAVTGIWGKVSGSLSKNTNPEADDRYWDNLPEKVGYGTFAAGSLQNPGIRLSNGNAPHTMHVRDNGNCKIVWARSREAY